MGDLHEMIVNHVGEVVGRVPIALDEDEVILILVLLVVAVDLVDEEWAAFAPEAHDVFLAVGSAAFGLRGGDTTTRPRVVCRAAAIVENLLLVALEVVRCAEAAVCLAILQELGGVLFIVVQTF